MGEISGKDLSGLGFAVGFERVMLALEAAGIELDSGAPRGVYVVCVDESVRPTAFSLMQQLRDVGIPADGDTQGRSVKSQFKVAGKSNARACVVVGPDELSSGGVTVRDMDTHDEQLVPTEKLVEKIRALY